MVKQQHTPEDENLHRQRIAKDKEGMSQSEVAGVESRRGAIRSGLLGLGATGLFLSGVDNTAKAEYDAVQRALETKREGEKGEAENVDGMIKDADKKKKESDEAYQQENPSAAKQLSTGLISDILGSLDLWRDLLVPTLLKVIKEAALMRHMTNREIARVDAEAAEHIRQKATPGELNITDDEVNTWVSDVEMRAKDVLDLSRNSATGLTDLLTALNALEGVINRAPYNVKNGNLGKSIENLGVNIPILIALVRKNWTQYGRGDTEAVDQSNRPRVRRVRDRARTQGTNIRNTSSS